MVTMTKCLTEQQLEDLVAGILSETSKVELEAHLAECAECREAIEECQENLAFRGCGSFAAFPILCSRSLSLPSDIRMKKRHR